MLIDRAIETVHSGYPAGWFQPTYKSMLDVWRLMYRMLKPYTSYVSVQDKRMEFSGGGMVNFWPVDADPEACRGQKFKRVLVNEAAKCRYLKTAWELAITPTLLDYGGDAWIGSTPRGRDYFWEMHQRGCPENRDTEKCEGWMSWTMPTEVNDRLKNRIKWLAQRKLELPSDVYAQEHEAKFLELTGNFFDRWEPTTKVLVFDDATGSIVEEWRPWHVIPTEGFSPTQPCWGSLDYGTDPTKMTGAFLLHVEDSNGGVTTALEIGFQGKLAPEQAQIIMEELQRYGLAQPDIAGRPGGRWTTKLRYLVMDWGNTFPPVDPKQRNTVYPAEHFAQKGFRVVPADKDRESGLSDMKWWLTQCVTFTDAYGDVDTYAKWRVMDRCTNLIRTMPLMQRDPKNHEDMDTTLEDHFCFVAGTPVMTPAGEVPIESLRVGDLVVTRGGAFPIAVATERSDQPVYEVSVSGGRSITGTGCHPVFVQGKQRFLPIDTLRYGDRLFAYQEVSQWKAIGSKWSSLTESNSGGTQTRRGWRIAGTTGRVLMRRGGAWRRYTERCGSQFMGRSPQGITSTTRMATPGITVSRTLSVYPEGSTLAITAEGQNAPSRAGRTSPRPVWRPKSGMGLRLAGHGTHATQTQQGLGSGRHGVGCAITVGRTTTAWGLSVGSAQTPVSRRSEGRAGSTMSPRPVRPAGQSSQPTDTASSDAAPVLVQGVCPAGRATVYNLQVDGPHEYFAGGVLVANCDAARYGLRRPKKMEAGEAQRRGGGMGLWTPMEDRHLPPALRSMPKSHRRE